MSRRLPLSAALLALAAVPAASAAQAPVRVSYAFVGDSRARAGEAGAVTRVLNVRQLKRAWQDSVDVLLDQAMDGAPGFARAREGERAQYRVEVMPLPITAADGRPTGVVTFALTLFEPAFTVPWKYVATSVAYTAGAAPAAEQIAAFATRAIADRRAQ